MNLSYICCTFDSVEEMHDKIKELSIRGITAMEWDDYELWCEFDLTGCIAHDVEVYFKES